MKNTKLILKPGLDRFHKVEIVWGCDYETDMPADNVIIDWVCRVLTECAAEVCEVSIRIVSESEMTNLNSSYRNKTTPTNVLSFPLDVASEDGRRLLGDIAICAAVVASEAKAQGKSLYAHFAHILVHGVLHLQGFDHSDDEEAEQMEQNETRIMGTMGFSDPYWPDKE